MSQPMQPEDPAYWMLVKGQQDPTWRTVPEVYRHGCYICNDPEFATMGLPLCKPCPRCAIEEGPSKGHIPADDVVCDDCGYDTQQAWEEEDARARQEAESDPLLAQDAVVVLEHDGSLQGFQAGLKQRLLHDHEQQHHPKDGT